MLPRNILCSLVLKLNVTDIKMYSLSLSVVKLFQDAGSLELEETERAVNDVAFSTAISL